MVCVGVVVGVSGLMCTGTGDNTEIRTKTQSKDHTNHDVLIFRTKN